VKYFFNFTQVYINGLQMRQIVLSEITLEELCVAVAEKVMNKFAEKQKEKINKNTEYITRKEAAQLLKISLPTLSKYGKQGRIPSYRIGGNIRLKKSDIDQMVNDSLRFKYKWK
jgi:excisionase family DNA binding protein